MTTPKRDPLDPPMAASSERVVEIVSVSGGDELDDIRSLLLEYGRLRSFDEALGDYEEELVGLPGEYAAPEGHLLLARLGSQSVGCVGLRRIDEQICEMKRMYVRETQRGQGVGRALAEALLARARLAGYRRMRLDTHPWMAAAQGLYSALGFREIDAYRFNPIEGVRFFEIDLEVA